MMQFLLNTSVPLQALLPSVNQGCWGRQRALPASAGFLLLLTRNNPYAKGAHFGAASPGPRHSRNASFLLLKLVLCLLPSPPVCVVWLCVVAAPRGQPRSGGASMCTSTFRLGRGAGVAWCSPAAPVPPPTPEGPIPWAFLPTSSVRCASAVQWDTGESPFLQVWLRPVVTVVLFHY